MTGKVHISSITRLTFRPGPTKSKGKCKVGVQNIYNIETSLFISEIDLNGHIGCDNPYKLSYRQVKAESLGKSFSRFVSDTDEMYGLLCETHVILKKWFFSLQWVE